jgi:hypothetical protein
MERMFVSKRSLRPEGFGDEDLRNEKVLETKICTLRRSQRQRLACRAKLKIHVIEAAEEDKAQI